MNQKKKVGCCGREKKAKRYMAPKEILIYRRLPAEESEMVELQVGDAMGGNLFEFLEESHQKLVGYVDLFYMEDHYKAFILKFSTLYDFLNVFSDTVRELLLIPEFYNQVDSSLYGDFLPLIFHEMDDEKEEKKEETPPPVAKKIASLLLKRRLGRSHDHKKTLTHYNQEIVLELTHYSEAFRDAFLVLLTLVITHPEILLRAGPRKLIQGTYKDPDPQVFVISLAYKALLSLFFFPLGYRDLRCDDPSIKNLNNPNVLSCCILALQAISFLAEWITGFSSEGLVFPCMKLFCLCRSYRPKCKFRPHTCLGRVVACCPKSKPPLALYLIERLQEQHGMLLKAVQNKTEKLKPTIFALQRESDLPLFLIEIILCYAGDPMLLAWYRHRDKFSPLFFSYYHDLLRRSVFKKERKVVACCDRGCRHAYARGWGRLDCDFSRGFCYFSCLKCADAFCTYPSRLSGKINRIVCNRQQQCRALLGLFLFFSLLSFSKSVLSIGSRF